MKLQNSIALVTGASTGIGRATAIMLAKNGVSVIINYHNNKISAEETLLECNKFSQGNMILMADISNEEEILLMIKSIAEKFDHIDILINNAGIFAKTELLDQVELFEDMFKYNFFSHIRVTNAVLPLMTRGKIVNTSSIHGQLRAVKEDGIAAYAASKAALNSYTKNLATKLAPNILVNAVAPGSTLTPIWGNLTKEEERNFGSILAINRFIKPEEIASAIEFLLLNDAMVGEILTIDGGWSLRV